LPSSSANLDLNRLVERNHLLSVPAPAAPALRGDPPRQGRGPPRAGQKNKIRCSASCFPPPPSPFFSFLSLSLSLPLPLCLLPQAAPLLLLLLPSSRFSRGKWRPPPAGLGGPPPLVDECETRNNYESKKTISGQTGGVVRGSNFKKIALCLTFFFSLVRRRKELCFSSPPRSTTRASSRPPSRPATFRDPSALSGASLARKREEERSKREKEAGSLLLLLLQPPLFAATLFLLASALVSAAFSHFLTRDAAQSRSLPGVLLRQRIRAEGGEQARREFFVFFSALRRAPSSKA